MQRSRFFRLAPLLMLLLAGGSGGFVMCAPCQGDACTVVCRDAELQQVLERLDARLSSPSLGETLPGGWADAVQDTVAPYRALIRRAAEEGRADVTDAQGRSLLYAALYFDLPELAPYLLEQGCNPNLAYNPEQIDNYAETPLTAAFHLGFMTGEQVSTEQRIASLTLLCRHGADWEKMPRAELIWAAALIHTERFGDGDKLLRAGLELGYRPKLYSRDGAALFRQLAALPRAVELVQELQHLGCMKAGWNSPLGEDATPLGMAVAAKNPALVAWLLEQGAAPDSARDSLLLEFRSYHEPEDEEDAAEAEKLTDILELLLKHGLTPSPADQIPLDKLPPRAAELLK